MKPTILPKNKLLNIIFAVCFLIFTLVNFFSDYIPCLVSWGQNFENLIYRLSFAVIPSYIFYFIVIHLKSNQDKKNILPIVVSYNSNMSKNYRNLFNAIHQTANKPQEKDTIEEHTDLTLARLTEDSIEESLHLIDINSPTPYLILYYQRYMNWKEFLKSVCDDVKKDIDDLMLISHYLDSEHIKILHNIKTSELIKITNHFNYNNLAMPNDSFWLYKRYFYSFHVELQKLEKYNSKLIN
ncbi:hypothetical protein I6F43_00450 [Pseudoalteromonas sp. NZS71_1]|uniref:hypothetical protein n=1 Tax=Pseudoalteromonas sp. NZS71_1 TaxID=2792072 RepID=UPI0018CD0357|nr:hypothetical protein [Pseudoalteromonas sp. NZS71_1]MBH0033166.1 hypothetical protein [Pseudoalteromonas sp. NZS71_1]